MDTSSTETGAALVRVYPSPVLLAALGPMVRASWSVPSHLAAEKKMAREAVPPAVSGYLLLDTGSSRTSIAEEVAEELGLSPQGYEAGHGVAGSHRAAIYLAELSLQVSEGEGLEAFMGAVVPAAGVPGLASSLPLLERGEAVRVVGLLGREFLRHVVFTYDGPGGRIRIEVDRSTLPVRNAPWMD